VDSGLKGRFIRRSRLLLLACLTATCASFGQEARNAGTSGVEIIKIHWERQVRLPRNFDPSVIPTNNSFPDPASRASAPPPPTDGTSARRVALANAGASGAPAGPESQFPDAPAHLPVFYVYSMEIRNAGPARVEAVAWDYLFLDAKTNAVLGAHHLFNYDKVQPGHSATLRAAQRIRPIPVVNAQNEADAKDPKGRRLAERAVIRCVIYEDKTAWKNPADPEDVCGALKAGMPDSKRGHEARPSKSK
jgi:hypothetical protein